jgi:hypothetical protein
MPKSFTDICSVAILAVVLFLVLSGKKRVNGKRVGDTEDDDVHWL